MHPVVAWHATSLPLKVIERQNKYHPQVIERQIKHSPLVIAKIQMSNEAGQAIIIHIRGFAPVGLAIVHIQLWL